MQSVGQLGYLGLSVSDLEAWRDFATATLGLQPAGEEGAADPESTALRLRMDEYRTRLLVYPTGADDLAFIGWEVPGQAALEALAGQLEAASVPVARGTAQETAEPGVASLIRFQDPNGIEQEIFCGAELSFEHPFHSPRPISGFVTGEQGLGHVVLAVQSIEESLPFYRDVLGFRESDYIHFGPRDRPVRLAFLHCNPRHHTVALLEAPLPRKLHHLMLQLQSLDDVGAAYYLCQDREIPISATLGRHTNDHMLSFYMVSPSGFEIEYGWGARTIDDATWQVQTHRSGSMWGHERPKSSRGRG